MGALFCTENLENLFYFEYRSLSTKKKNIIWISKSKEKDLFRPVSLNQQLFDTLSS